jgi:hypothetical protein
MNFFLTLPRFQTRSIAAINNDINDELEFHLHCRVDELVAEGMTRELATQQARADFGSPETIRKQCQQISYGARTWLTILNILGLTFLSLAVCWLSWQLITVKGQNAVMAKQLVSSSSPSGLMIAPGDPAQDKLHDLTGTISGPDGPVADAKVLLIFKSWPGGNYHQEAKSTTTDEKGKFRFEELYAVNMQTAYLVSVVKDGLTLESKYWVNDKRRKVKSVKIRLKKAIEKTLTIRDGSGELLANSEVFVQSRNFDPNGGSGDMIYPQSRSEIMKTTDANGKVSIGNFVTKDKAIVSYVTSDGRLVDIGFTVDDKPEQSIGGGGGAPKGAVAAGVAKAGKLDLTGVVTGEDGGAIADATVLLVHKTWKNNRYGQDFFKTTTDAEGNFTFPKRYDHKQRYAFLVSVVADGWAMNSNYVFNQNGGELEPYNLRMEKANTKTFAFQNPDGTALTSTKVFPSTRKTEDGDEFMIFPQAGGDVDTQTDEEGKVQLNYFVNGDTATFGFANGGKVEVEINGDPEQTVVLKKK